MQSFRQSMRDLVRSFIAPRPMLQMMPWERSVRLLKQNLSPTQLKQYEWHNHFDVIGGCSGNRYRIRHGNVMNVELLDKNGRRVGLLCFMPLGRVPLGDVMLAQKIALELFEVEAIRIANKMPALENLPELELHPLSSRW